MNLLKYYWKFSQDHRKILLDLANLHSWPPFTANTVMFMEYEKAIEYLKEYYKIGDNMYVVDYALIEMFKILEFEAECKPDPRKRSYRAFLKGLPGDYIV